VAQHVRLYLTLAEDMYAAFDQIRELADGGAGLWAEAAQALPADADHTEIARWLDPERFHAD